MAGKRDTGGAGTRQWRRAGGNSEHHTGIVGRASSIESFTITYASNSRQDHHYDVEFRQRFQYRVPQCRNICNSICSITIFRSQSINRTSIIERRVKPRQLGSCLHEKRQLHVLRCGLEQSAIVDRTRIIELARESKCELFACEILTGH